MIKRCTRILPVVILVSMLVPATLLAQMAVRCPAGGPVGEGGGTLTYNGVDNSLALRVDFFPGPFTMTSIDNGHIRIACDNPSPSGMNHYEADFFGDTSIFGSTLQMDFFPVFPLSNDPLFNHLPACVNPRLEELRFDIGQSTGEMSSYFCFAGFFDPFSFFIP